MSGEIRRDQLGEIRSTRWRHDHIDGAHEVVPFLDSDRPQTIGVYIIDGGNEARRPEGVRPVELPLLYELIVATRSREIVERRGGFRSQNDAHRVVRDIGQ